jgi:hypothetical protein
MFKMFRWRVPQEAVRLSLKECLKCLVRQEAVRLSLKECLKCLGGGSPRSSEVVSKRMFEMFSPPGGSEVVSKRMFKMFRWRVPQQAARLSLKGC